MYDTSSKTNWGRDDPNVPKDWLNIMKIANENFDFYVKDSAGNFIFLAFGATPMPKNGV